MFGLFRSNDPEIVVTVDRPEGAYCPGDVVRATIAMTAKKAAKVREVRAGLVCAERYKVVEERRDSDGDRSTTETWKSNEHWVTKELLVQNDSIPAGHSENLTFEWPIPPDAPASGNGKITEIRWMAKVTVDRAMARDTNQESELQLLLPPAGRETANGDYSEDESQDAVDMRFTLPGLEYRAGATITGRLSLAPQQQIKARSIRVDLVQVETVIPGRRQNTESTVQGSVTVASGVRLDPGTPLSYEFALPTPSTITPARQTPNGEVRWIIRGVVDRTMASDYVLEQEILLYNGPSQA